jgi:hypothetical protein
VNVGHPSCRDCVINVLIVETGKQSANGSFMVKAESILRSPFYEFNGRTVIKLK